jgi:predicted permease
MTSFLAGFLSRFSVRALDLRLDATLLWVGAASALVCAVLLALVPRLPSPERDGGLRLALSGVRVVGAANRRLRVFAVLQVAASFVLVAGSLVLLRTLLTLQATDPGFETRGVLAVNVPVTTYNRTPEQVRDFYTQLHARVSSLPGVERVAFGSTVPWRDSGGLNGTFAFRVEGARSESLDDDPRAKFRSVSPGFFAALGIPILAGRDFTADDRADGDRVVIVSSSIAEELFADRKVVDRELRWTDVVMQFIGVSQDPRRIVGVVADVVDEGSGADGEAASTRAVYHPFEQQLAGGRLFVHARGNPYELVPTITQMVREMAADQPIEQAATLADIRAEVLAPVRLNTMVFGGFAAVALAISIVGVAGVLAFSVSGRTRELGLRLALGSYPSRIMLGILGDGLAVGIGGLLAGGVGGFLLIRVAGRFINGLEAPGALALVGAALLLLLAAVVASIAPAARAARVDVMRALQTD